MKLGIIGAGKVGCACLLAAVTRGNARQIVLVNRTRKTAEAAVTDVRYGVPLGRKVDVIDGDYEELNGAGVVIVTFGINEKTGHATDRNDPEGRLRLLDENAAIYRNIIPKIAAVAREAVLLVVTDPPDPLADLARESVGSTHILSAGTFLDSLRFRVHLGGHFGVDPAHVDAQVIGEHGTSQVFLWSSAQIGGVPVEDLLRHRGEKLKDVRPFLEKAVRYANITIIEGINASQYGIGIVAARIAEMVLSDERAAVPIGSFQKKFGVTLSLPSIVGRNGVLNVLEPELSEDERQELEKSAQKLRSTPARLQQA